MATTAEAIQAIRVGINLQRSGTTVGGMDITIADQVKKYYIKQDPSSHSDCFRLYNREYQAISRGAEVYMNDNLLKLIFADDSQIVIPISSEPRTGAQKKWFKSVGYYNQEVEDFYDDSDL